MTQAVAVRRDGDAFQARWFWLKAARLLDVEGPVLRVGFETGPKGFDDIWVEYDPKRAPSDQEGKPLLREHVQCKWHVTPDTFGYAHLVDPEFINANARSLLQRAQAAQQTYAAQAEGIHFRLVTNWQIDRKDPLRTLINNRSHGLRLDQLFDTTTDRSAMGRVRKLWREHLGIDDSQLRLLARTLAVASPTDSLDALRERLDDLFRVAGLRRVPANESAFVYDDVVFQWLNQGRLVLDRDGLHAALERENLLGGRAPRPTVFGVKSFEHPIDRLEERCTAVLNLVSHFDERFIRTQVDWSSALYPSLSDFLLTAAKNTERLRLILDAHLTLGFAAGSILNIKSGRTIELEQRTLGRNVWAADDADHDSSWPSLKFEPEILEGGTDIAVAIGLTHDITAAVRAYVKTALPNVGTLLVAGMSSGPSARSVACGRHAFEIAETLTTQVRATKPEEQRQRVVHLFLAAPGGFAFFLGQRQPALGRVVLYEFDFEGTRTGTYEPSLSLPIS